MHSKVQATRHMCYPKALDNNHSSHYVIVSVTVAIVAAYAYCLKGHQNLAIFVDCHVRGLLGRNDMPSRLVLSIV